MATATQATGFDCCCPHCGAKGDEGLLIQVSDLTLKCSGCDEEVTRQDLERLISDAQRLLRWLALAETV